MALFRRLQTIRAVSRTLETRDSSYLFGSSISYYSNFSNGLEFNSWQISLCLYKGRSSHPWIHGNTMTLCSSEALSLFSNNKRWVTTQVRAPPQSRQMKKESSFGDLNLCRASSMRSIRKIMHSGWFTKSGWRRTKDDIILEVALLLSGFQSHLPLKSAYAISKLRKSGYLKNQFYKEAVELYKEISTLIANGDKNSLRKAVTEKMYSELKNKIKRRESNWSEVYWEMIEPVIKIRTLLARLKFEAYDAKGAVVAGDKTKELAHPFSLNCKTMVLPFLGRLYHISSNSQSILSKIRFFSTQHPICNSFPEKPTATYYDDLINAAGHERDFDKLHYLLNRRVRDDCHNTSNTFKFITNTATSLSILEDLIQTLARLDNGLPRTSAYNALIARLCRLGRFSESLHIVDIMACEQYGLSTRSFHPILKFLTRKKKMEDAWHVIEMMKAVGVSPDLIAFNYLLAAYCYYGNLMHAVKVMKRIEEESLGADARTYDALVLGACRAGKVEGALAVLRRMEDDGVHVLYSTHMHIINTFLKLGYYAQAVRFMMIYGGRDALWATENFGVLASKLIKLERLKEAKLVLEEMEKKSLVMGDKLRECYNSIVKNVK